MLSKEQRQANEKAGRRAETLAVWFLRLKGYQILSRRYKTKQGEIDIAARKGKAIVVIEVKQRQSAEAAIGTVGYANQKRIIAAAEIFLTRHPQFTMTDYELRFDIIHVIGRWKIVHLRDGFRGY